MGFTSRVGPARSSRDCAKFGDTAPLRGALGFAERVGDEIQHIFSAAGTLGRRRAGSFRPKAVIRAGRP